MAEAIARHARRGDQLIVDARVRANNWTDSDGERTFGHSFICEGFRFGAPGRAKREELDAARVEA
jgi:single-strand DNA-binding protein